MIAVEDISLLKQFREKLQPHGIKIWSSSELLSEEVLQQLIQSDEDTQYSQSRAEELYPQAVIDQLPEGTSKIQINHFIDGSPRTLNVGFLLSTNGISYPVSLSHVGAVSVAFIDGRWRETGFEQTHLILASVNQAMGLGNIQINGKWKLEDPTDKLSTTKQINVTDTVEMRGAAIRRARRRMRNCEKELIKKLSQKNPVHWIAADGTLFDVEGYSDIKDVKVVGISKSFTLNPIVERNGNQERMGYLVGILTDLPVGSRSPVYKLTPEINRLDKYTYMWFIRIHKARQSPISGIVKVELPPSDCYKDDTKMRLNTINAISHSIFRLRNPYLFDNRRGESFLYPIYVAENLIKSKLKSVEKLKGIWESSQY